MLFSWTKNTAKFNGWTKNENKFAWFKSRNKFYGYTKN